MPQRRFAFIQKLRRRDLPERHAGDFLQGVADDLGEARVASENPACECDMNDAHRGLFKGFAKALLAVAELHFRTLALGNVRDEAFQAERLFIGAADSSRAERNPENGAALALEPALKPAHGTMLFKLPH